MSLLDLVADLGRYVSDSLDETVDAVVAETSTNKLLVIISPELVNRDPLNDARVAAMAARFAASSQGHDVVTVALSNDSGVAPQNRAADGNFGKCMLVHVRNADELFTVLTRLARQERLTATTEPMGKLTSVAITHPTGAGVPKILERLDLLEMEVDYRIPRVGVFPGYAVQNGIKAETAAQADGNVRLPAVNQVSDEALLRVAGFDRIITDSQGYKPLLDRMAKLLSASGLAFRRLVQKHGLSELPSPEKLVNILRSDIIEVPLPSAKLARELDSYPQSIAAFRGTPEARELVEFGAPFISSTGLDRPARELTDNRELTSNRELTQNDWGIALGPFIGPVTCVDDGAYLSPEWFEAMQTAAVGAAPNEPTSGKVSLRETVTGSPYGDVSWVLTIEDGKVSLDRDDAVEPDVNFRQDYETAAALHRGEMTTQQAFFEGRVRVAGRLNTLLAQADLLTGVAPIFEQVRKETTY